MSVCGWVGSQLSARDVAVSAVEARQGTIEVALPPGVYCSGRGDSIHQGELSCSMLLTHLTQW